MFIQKVLELKAKIMAKNCGNCHWQFISTLDRGTGYTSCAFDLVLRPSKNEKCYRWQEYQHGPSPEKRVDMATELQLWEREEEKEEIIKETKNSNILIVAAAVVGVIVGFVLGFLV